MKILIEKFENGLPLNQIKEFIEENGANQREEMERKCSAEKDQEWNSSPSC